MFGAMNVRVQTHRAISTLLGKLSVFFPETCLCDERHLTAQMVEWESVLKRYV
jgi:hypothetical protein